MAASERLADEESIEGLAEIVIVIDCFQKLSANGLVFSTSNPSNGESGRVEKFNRRQKFQ